MSTDSQPDDSITQAILSGSTYEKVRFERHSYVRQSIPRTLVLQSALLGLLALLLPMYGLYPKSVAPYLPAVDPMLASPKVVMIGVFGGLFQLLAAIILVGTAVYRLRNGPLTEAQAHAVLDAEDFARYVGLGTGGLAILVAVLLSAIGLGGGDAVSSYVATMGRNPFVDSGFGLSVGVVALGAFACSVALFFAGNYLAVLLIGE